ncbi:MAG: universal stress protein [Haloarculaceae archaeon]
MADTVDLVLAPVDATEEAERAAEYAVAVADRYEADLHLLHVLDERVAHGIETGDVDPDGVASEHRAFTDVVRDHLHEADDVGEFTHSACAGFSPRRLTQSPGSVILDVADDVDADFIVLPRESPTADPDETLGKAALYVLEYASQPVLSV